MVLWLFSLLISIRLVTYPSEKPPCFCLLHRPPACADQSPLAFPTSTAQSVCPTSSFLTGPRAPLPAETTTNRRPAPSSSRCSAPRPPGNRPMEFSRRGPATDGVADGHRCTDPPPHGTCRSKQHRWNLRRLSSLPAIVCERS
jgi:hypothetical protein